MSLYLKENTSFIKVNILDVLTKLKTPETIFEIPCYVGNPDKKIKVTACFVLLGLVTYFTHSLFNNFLENDKLAFLFWMSLSILATLDSSSRAGWSAD